LVNACTSPGFVDYGRRPARHKAGDANFFSVGPRVMGAPWTLVDVPVSKPEGGALTDRAAPTPWATRPGKTTCYR